MYKFKSGKISLLRGFQLLFREGSQSGLSPIVMGLLVYYDLWTQWREICHCIIRFIKKAHRQGVKVDPNLKPLQGPNGLCLLQLTCTHVVIDLFHTMVQSTQLANQKPRTQTTVTHSFHHIN